MAYAGVVMCATDADSAVRMVKTVKMERIVSGVHLHRGCYVPCTDSEDGVGEDREAG